MTFTASRRVRFEGLVVGKPISTRGRAHVKFLAISTNTKDVSPFIATEFQRVDELRAAGTIADGWVKTDFSGAVLVLDCADAAEATAVRRPSGGSRRGCAGSGRGSSERRRPSGVFGYIVRMTGRGKSSSVAGGLHLAGDAGRDRASLACRAWMR